MCDGGFCLARGYCLARKVVTVTKEALGPANLEIKLLSNDSSLSCGKTSPAHLEAGQGRFESSGVAHCLPVV